MELIALVDDYVFGHALRSTEYEPDDGELAAHLEYMAARLEIGEYPHMRSALGGGELTETVERMATMASDPDRFERGVSRLLDGIEPELQRRGSARRSQARPRRTPSR